MGLNTELLKDIASKGVGNTYEGGEMLAPVKENGGSNIFNGDVVEKQWFAEVERDREDKEDE